MKEVDIAKLVSTVVLLGQARATIMFNLPRMTEILAPSKKPARQTSGSGKILGKLFSKKLSEKADLLAETEQQLRLASAEHDRNVMASVESALVELIKHLEDFELTLTLAHARRLKKGIETEKQSPTAAALGELTERLFDEVRSRRFLAFSPELGGYYNTQQFAPEIRLKFPAAVVDIDEAMNCLALERSTASVFHLMRVMEVAVRATASCLGVPDPVRASEKNWGVMLGSIKGGINSKWPTSADKMGPDAKFFESLLASLEAVKNPWRNATMHVENSYTMAEAQRIRHAVEGLMLTMASRFDEKGDPKV
ncbi:hypothetical protein JQ544_11510 [Bradyrhizobium diazoefficiens]|nr:hypothetical protein [Bradyrhizobium diazoefficiens]MBR0812154.1 hypothetical protein [Bradyrhizobium diazoefficiens]